MHILRYWRFEKFKSCSSDQFHVGVHLNMQREPLKKLNYTIIKVFTDKYSTGNEQKNYCKLSR